MAGPKVTDPTTDFFEGLRERGYEARLRGASGSFRFELVEGKSIERWFVSVSKGNVTVARRGGAADCVLHADRKLFNQLASGELNGVAAALRGEFHAEGDWRLLVLFQRLFPGKKPSAPQKARAGYARRSP